MEKLGLHLIQLHKSLKTLEDALDHQEETAGMSNQKFLLAAEDSTIKRFEYSYEIFWKFLKKYLELIHHLEDVNSPKKVFRASVQVSVCTLAEGSIFIDMADARNETSHTYNIETSRVILSIIPSYYSAMIAVTKRLDGELGQPKFFSVHKA